MRALTVTGVMRLGILAATLVVALWIGSIAAENPAVQGLILQGGYLGVFLFSVINGFNVVVPVVSASFVPALTNAGLDPILTVLVMTAGMTIADSTAYFLGRAGRVHIGRYHERITHSLQRAEAQRRMLPLGMLALWSAFVPLPTEIMALPVGIMGYRPREVLPIFFVGNLIFNTLIGFGFVNIVLLWS